MSVKRGILTYENKLISVLCLAFGIVFFDRNALSYLIPFVGPELHLTNTKIGLLSSGLSFAWAVSGTIVGAFSDSTGRRKSFLLVSIVLFSLCSVASGFAVSFLTLIAARILMGIAEGPILPIAQSLLALESSDERRGLNMGVMQNLGSNVLGSFVAPLVLVALANAYSWRVAFFIAGVPGLVAAYLIYRTVREPKPHPVAGDALAPRHRTTGERHVAGSRIGLEHLARHRNIWLAMLIAPVMVAWMVLAWAFMPLFLVQVRHMSPSEMSVLMSVLGVSAGVCSFVVPGLSDRLGRKPVMIGFSFLGALVPLATLYFSGPVLMLAVLLFVGWSASGTFPLFMATIPSETVAPRFFATTVGLIIGCGETLGGFGSPILAGWLADRTSLAAPLLMEGACALVAGSLSLFLRETAPVKRLASAQLVEDVSQ